MIARLRVWSIHPSAIQACYKLFVHPKGFEPLLQFHARIKSPKPNHSAKGAISAPTGTRTLDPQLKRLQLYQLSYRSMLYKSFKLIFDLTCMLLLVNLLHQFSMKTYTNYCFRFIILSNLFFIISRPTRIRTRNNGFGDRHVTITSYPYLPTPILYNNIHN